VQAAAVPTTPVAPNPEFAAVIAGVVGALLAYGILLMRNLLNTKLRNVEDLEAVSNLPILAEFPKPAKKTRRLPREASGYLRTNLLLATQNVHPKVILVTSPSSGEGKSSVALSLAESFTRANYRTLLVDADLRQPVIAREYNLDDKRHMPLRTHLENPHGSYEAAHVGVNLAQTLDIIPTFRAAPSPTELLSLGFPGSLESWEKDYDVIVIDSAPLLDVADTLTIAPLCTGTVLVASLEETNPQQIEDAVELLQRSGVRIFGIAATFVGRRVTRSSYRYSRDTAELLEERDHPAPQKMPANAANLNSRPR
jgi:capsular exopolysaccharide synthesis family protein